ncbi:MAG: ATP-binding protein, partial [Oscillospiraceae bacterium]
MTEMTLQATPQALDRVLAFIDEKLEANSCPQNVQVQIDIAVEEIYVNIAHYAYRPDMGPVTIRVEMGGEPLQAAITFVDHGVPYNPLAKADPDLTLSAQERQIGGLGIFMVKQSMDDVRY